MQKVRCVFKEQLSHLTDVVVFSAKGSCSLASKCQGGDYDGDTFWICREQLLVEPFLNAPVPDIPANPAPFGIRVDKETLGEIVPVTWGEVSEADVLRWVQRSTAARMQFNWLGTVTLTYGRLIYHNNSVVSRAAHQLVCLHSYLIDADKQGHSFSGDAWNDIRKSERIKDLQEPAYRVLTSGREPASWKSEDIVDFVFFEVVKPVLAKTLKVVQDVVRHASSRDLDLARFYQNTLASAVAGPADRELAQLAPKIDRLRDIWRTSAIAYHNTRHKTPEDWRRCVSRVRAEFEAITPEDVGSETALAWMLKHGSAPTSWDLLKASAMASRHPDSKATFNAAGFELCRLKADCSSTGEAKLLDEQSYYNLKPRKRKWEEVGMTIDGGDDAEDEKLS